MARKFDVGDVFATAGIYNSMNHDPKFASFTRRSLERHAQGDWGDLPEEDKLANDEALKDGSRLLSAYQFNDKEKVWIITEADRSHTTVLSPSEY